MGSFRFACTFTGAPVGFAAPPAALAAGAAGAEATTTEPKGFTEGGDEGPAVLNGGKLLHDAREQTRECVVLCVCV